MYVNVSVWLSESVACESESQNPDGLFTPVLPIPNILAHKGMLHVKYAFIVVRVMPILLFTYLFFFLP